MGRQIGISTILAPNSTSPDSKRVPAQRWWRGEGVSRRVVAIVITLLLELLILLVLLSLGVGKPAEPPGAANVTTFDTQASPKPDSAESAQAAEQAPAPTDAEEPQPTALPAPTALPPSALPRMNDAPAPPAQPEPSDPLPAPQASATPRIRAVIRPGSNIGPPDSGRRGGADSEIVGTAPDGSPLYAARWYTEPTEQQLAGYLSGARGPGWGLIACKTAPNWRVEDCVVLGESPAGSNIAGAFNAAAWQFLVRPPRVGGEYQVGSWVRIRLTMDRAQNP